MLNTIRTSALSFFVLVFVSTLLTINVNAQDQEERINQLETQVEQLLAEKKASDSENDGLLKLIESINLGFYVDTLYEYNFNDPDSGENSFRSLDRDHNEFEIQAAQIYFEKVPELGENIADLIGFRIDLLFGEIAPRVAAAGLSSDVVDLEQAYINVLAPIGNGLNIYAGKYVTLAGYEVIEAKNNPNITRSFLFGLAIPFTHTGVRTSYGVGPLSFTLGLNNGWDLVDDNNDGKTIESRIAYGGDLFSLSLAGYFGPEQDGSDGDFFGGDWRELIDVVGSLSPLEWLTLGINADFGWEQGVTDVDLGLDEDGVFWWGVAGYVVADIHPAVSLRLRLEYFNDDDGFRTGTPGGADLYSITPTVAFKPFKGKIVNLDYLDNLEFRVEYRFDGSDEDIFEDEGEDNFTDQQHTISAQLLYWLDI
ncbi:MAG: porin [Thermodesulfobacteriota bacterium]